MTGNYAIAIFCYPVKASGDLVVQSIIVTGHNADRASQLRDALQKSLEPR